MILRPLKDYSRITGKDVVDEIISLAERLKGKVIQNINATAEGGGVAEVLRRVIPILNELGINARWDVMKGNPEFFEVTKAFHNTLHGQKGSLTDKMKKIFLKVTDQNLNEMVLDGDIIFIHDPQPAGLVTARNGQAKKSKWIWRCHIDLSNPNQEFWGFLKGFVDRYDASVFSTPFFAQKLAIPEYLIAPSIDPLSEKNCDLPQEEVVQVLEKYQIDPKRPIITQVSRFDYLKDPVGVIEVFKKVQRSIDCQLILAGGGASDDPEGEKVLGEVKAIAGNDQDIHILSLPPDAHREINAIQRGSTIIMQKSIKEGFGLTVAEGMWKGKPLVASAVGGITLQVRHEITGLLAHSINGAIQAVKKLLANPMFAKQLGLNGRAHIKQNFLLTRHIRDYLLLFLAVEHYPKGIVHPLKI